MTISLKLDLRKPRGKSLQKALDDFPLAITSGAMHDKNCSNCNETVSSENSVKCCKCKVEYHVQCLTIPLPPDFAQLLMENLDVYGGAVLVVLNIQMKIQVTLLITSQQYLLMILVRLIL